MRLLLDQGLSRSAAGLLRKAGHEAIHVGEIGKATATDLEIIEFARQDDRVIATLDADFHAALAHSQATGSSVIWLRIEGLGADLTTTLILTVINACDRDLADGAAVTVYPDRVKVHALPIVPP